jgi:hypothetical protein
MPNGPYVDAARRHLVIVGALLGRFPERRPPFVVSLNSRSDNSRAK